MFILFTIKMNRKERKESLKRGGEVKIELLILITSYRKINIIRFIQFFILLDIFYYFLIFNLDISRNKITSIDIIIIILIDFLSLNVYMYSERYMNYDPYKSYFFFLLYLFIFTIKSFFLFSSFYTIFFICEIIGILSFLLIKFWSNSLINYKSAMKAIIWNRLGDVLFIYILINYDYLSVFSTSSLFFNFLFAFKSVQSLRFILIVICYVYSYSCFFFITFIDNSKYGCIFKI